MYFEIILLIGGGIAIFFLFLYFVPVNLWITATFSGVQISLVELMFMRIRKTPITDVVNTLIMSHKAGFPVKMIDLEVHALAGGNVQAVTSAYILLRKSDVPVHFKDITSVDLAGDNLDDFVSQKKKTTGHGDVRKSLCKSIMNELDEDQVTEVQKFMERLI